MKYKLVSLIGAALFCASLAHAATRIEKGKDYEFSGYLVVRMGAGEGKAKSKVYVALTSSPNGDATARGRQDITLVNGTFKENLVKLARATGSDKKMSAQGVGNADGALAVSYVGPEKDAPASAAKAVEAAKRDALERYSEDHPAVGPRVGEGIHPAVKSAKVEASKKRIVVECDRQGGFAGWNGPVIRYAYDLKGKYLGLADSNSSAGGAGDAEALMLACKRDAIGRYREDHPGMGGMQRPDFKSASIDKESGFINVVCDLAGGFAGWANQAVSYVYDETGKFVSETAE